MVIYGNKVISDHYFPPSFYSSYVMVAFLSIMVVSGTAGVIVSLSRIFTKLLVEDEKKNTIIFFLFSVSIETLCFLLHVVVRRTHFVRYHTDRARHSWLKGQINNVMTKKHSGYQIHNNSSAEEEVISHIEIMFPLDFWDFLGVGSLSICY